MSLPVVSWRDPATVGRVLALVYVFGVPWSTAWTYAGFGALLAWYVISGRYAEKWAALRRSPVALLALALFGWTALAIVWSQALPEEIDYDWLRYKKLLLVPVLIWSFGDAAFASPDEARRWRGRLLYAYLAGVGVLIGSGFYAGWGGLIWLRTGHFSFTEALFKNYITQGLHLAIFVFACLTLAAQTRGGRRAAWLAAGALGLAHALFLQGRMGLLMLTLSLLLFLLSLAKTWTQRVTATAAFALVGSLAFTTLPFIHDRAVRLWTETADITSGHSERSIRAEYARLSLALARTHPLIGAGPGSFKRRIMEDGRGGEFPIHRHTHDEYLTQLSQYGVVGLGLFLALMGTAVAQARARRDDAIARVALAALLLFLLGAWTDSELHNVHEGFMIVIFLALAASMQTPRRTP